MSRRKPLQPDAPPLSPLPPRPEPLTRGWHVAVALLFLAYLGLGFGHLKATPVSPSTSINYINAPDEAAHLLYIKAIAERGRLPVRGEKQYATYEWHQPPLYYAFCAPFFPYGPHVVRGVTLLLGALALWLVFRSARLAFPEEHGLAVLTLGCAALLPMREATTSSVGNDVLIELLYSACLMLLVTALAYGFNWRRGVVIGVCVAAAALTKASGLLLLPIIPVALFLAWRQGEALPGLAQGGLVILGVFVAGTSIWYARNLRLYHEFTPARAFVQEFEHTARAADFIGKDMRMLDILTGQPDLSTETRGQYSLLVADWTFGTAVAAYTRMGRDAAYGIPSFLPPGYYFLYALLGAAAIAGLIRQHLRRGTDYTKLQQQIILLCGLEIALVMASFAGFTWTFFQAQGRYLYPALLPLSLLGALGFRGILPARYRETATVLLLALLVVLAVAFLFTAVLPAYSVAPPAVR